MFKRYIISSLLMLGLAASAQAQKHLVLLEEFTNQGCDPCAEFSPSLDSCLEQRLGDVVAVTYHYNFPWAQDKIWLANEGDVTARAQYYNVTGVPSMFVGGMQARAWGSSVSDINSYIDWVRDSTSDKVRLDVNASIADGKLHTDVSVKPIDDYQGDNVRLFVVAVEELIQYAEKAPNREDHWYYVMRKILPTGEGQALSLLLSAGSTYNYSYDWTISGYDNSDELGLVTFVQDLGTGAILAANYTPRPTGSNDAAKILRVIDTPERICDPYFHSSLIVRNTGKNALTSADVNVSVNGTVQTTHWTGNLPYLGIDTISTQDFTDFALADKTNAVDIWLSNINGTSQESAHKHLSFASAVSAQSAVRLTIMTDRKPEETTWKVYNSAGDVVEQGGPYSEPHKRVIHTLSLDTDDCYQLEIDDAGGDGISGSDGNGYYKLDQMNADGTHKMLLQETFTGSQAYVNFSLHNADVTLGIDRPSTSVATGSASFTDLSGKRIPQSHNSERGLYIMQKDGETVKVIKK